MADIPYTESTQSAQIIDESTGNAAGITSESQLLSYSEINTKHLDTFGRLQVGLPQTLFDSKHIYDNQPLFWDDQQISGASTTSTYSQNRASVTLGVNAQTAGSRVRQTFRSFNYQPGKSQLVLMTGVIGSGNTSVTKRWGYFNEANGLFFEQVGTTLKVVRRSSATGSPVDTAVNQGSWNIDNLDGTGPSGLTLDITKSNIYVIEFQWLGVGSVFFAIKIGKLLVAVHEFQNANNLSSVYMSSGNLPLRWEIQSAGGGANTTVSIEHICCSVLSVGGQEKLGVSRSLSTQGTRLVASASGTLYAMIGIRLKSTALTASVFVESISVIAESVDDFEWEILLNPTVAGTFTFSDVTNSVIQSAFGATANTVTGGTLLASGFAKDSTPISEVLNNALTIGATIAGVADRLVLCIRPLSAGLNTQGSLTYRELI